MLKVLETQTEYLERVRSVDNERSGVNGMIQLSFGIDNVSEISSNIGIDVTDGEL